MAAYVTGNTTNLNAEELHHSAGRHPPAVGHVAPETRRNPKAAAPGTVSTVRVRMGQVLPRATHRFGSCAARSAELSR
ncbi:hypothetical protein GCM10023066_12070 [Nocardioides kongjuensis]